LCARSITRRHQRRPHSTSGLRAYDRSPQAPAPSRAPAVSRAERDADQESGHISCCVRRSLACPSFVWAARHATHHLTAQCSTLRRARRGSVAAKSSAAGELTRQSGNVAGIWPLMARRVAVVMDRAHRTLCPSEPRAPPPPPAPSVYHALPLDVPHASAIADGRTETKRVGQRCALSARAGALHATRVRVWHAWCARGCVRAWLCVRACVAAWRWRHRTTCCNPIQHVATQCRLLQRSTARCSATPPCRCGPRSCGRSGGCGARRSAR
jgi:hypothetical protein